MSLKNTMLILCFLSYGLLHAQKDAKDYAIIKAGIKLKSMQPLFQKLSKHAENIITGNPSKYVLKSESGNARSTAATIYSQFSAINIEIIKSESEYITFKKINSFPTDLKAKTRKILDYIQKAQNKCSSLENKFSYINKSNNIYLETGRYSKAISQDGKNLIWYYQSIVKMYSDYLNLYKK